MVGSFPEPFVHGTGGRRLPTTLACASDADAACKRVAAEFHSDRCSRRPTVLIGTGSGADSLAVVVGTWRDLHGELAATLVEHGPGSSGVYARFTGPGGSSLQLLNPARSRGPDAGCRRGADRRHRSELRPARCG